MPRNNQAQYLVQLEQKLYNPQVVTQLDSLSLIQDELLKPTCNTHQLLIVMISKYYLSTGLLQRIKIVNLVETCFKSMANEVEDWQPLIMSLCQDCYSNNYQLRIISIRGLYHLRSLFEEAFNIFHLIFETFLKGMDLREVKICYKLLQYLSKWHSYSLVNKLSQLPRVIPILQTQKLYYILKLLAELDSLELHIKQVKLYLQSFEEIKEVQLLYNYTKLAQLCQHQFTPSQEVIKNASQKWQNKFAILLKTQLVTNSGTLELLHNKCKDISPTQLLDLPNQINTLRMMITTYQGLLQVISFLQDVFDQACTFKLVTVSGQLECQLESLLIFIDQFIFEVYSTPNLFEERIIKCKLFFLAIQLKSAFTSIQTHIAVNECTFDKIINQPLYFKQIKMLFAFNIQVPEQKFNGLYVDTYYNYLKSLRGSVHRNYFADFQVDSNQYQIRILILDFYDRFYNQLSSLLDNLDDPSQNYAHLLNLLDDLGELFFKIQFYSNTLYALDALYLQRVVIEKLIAFISSKYMDIEYECTEDASSIISKLIKFNKIDFIRTILPNIRREKLQEFCLKIRTSVMYIPKILLNIIPVPKLKVSCAIQDEANRQYMVKITISIEKPCSINLIYFVNDIQYTAAYEFEETDSNYTFNQQQFTDSQYRIIQSLNIRQIVNISYLMFFNQSKVKQTFEDYQISQSQQLFTNIHQSGD